MLTSIVIHAQQFFPDPFYICFTNASFIAEIANECIPGWCRKIMFAFVLPVILLVIAAVWVHRLIQRKLERMAAASQNTG